MDARGENRRFRTKTRRCGLTHVGKAAAGTAQLEAEAAEEPGEEQEGLLHPFLARLGEESHLSQTSRVDSSQN